MVTHKAAIFAPKARRRVDLRLLNFWPYSTYFAVRLNAELFESLHFHNHERAANLKLYVCFYAFLSPCQTANDVTIAGNQKAFSIV